MLRYLALFIAVTILSASYGTAQQKTYTVSGTVSDNVGPLVGVTIYPKNKVSLGDISDKDGRFRINVEKGDVLVFSMLGYEDVEYAVSGTKDNVEIIMQEEAMAMDEVIVTALSPQRKISNVGAVTSIRADELQTPATSIVNMLGGKVPGIITMQSSGEPGKDISDFWVRGIGTFGANASALVLVDGLEGNLNSIDPADIESFSILKDASATAVYGVRGANGVVLVTTKRGKVDKLRITGRASFTVSQLKRLPEYVGASDYAMLANEARIVRNEQPLYTDVEMDIIRHGLDRDLYPDMDWQDEVIKRASLKQEYYVSASGGSQSARYFVSLNASLSDAAYKVDKSSPYSSGVGYDSYGFRANIDLTLTPTTTVYLGSDGTLNSYRQPGVANTDAIWAAQARINPLLLPQQYSNGQYPAVGTDSGISPYVMINRMGRRLDQDYSGKVTLALNQDLSMITEGLKFRLQGAYDLVSNFSESRLIQPALYEAVGRSQSGELVTVERVQSSAASYGRSTNQFRKYHFEATVNYDRVFKSDHRTSALVYYYMSDQKNANDGTTNMNSIPIRYQGISSRFTYGYRDTYLVDFNFGYTGSENFQPGRRFGFFPSIALGWVITGYDAVKKALPFMDLFKIRASYGSVGNDRITDRRFPYLTLVRRFSTSPFGSAWVEGLTEDVLGADNLVWEKAIKADLGIEGQFLHNKLSFVVDFFKDTRKGIFQQRVQVPIYVGLISMPYSNVGEMESFGADGNISYTHDFNTNISLTVRGNFTYSNNNVINWEEANPKYPYQAKSGYPLGPVLGYQSLGLFKDQHDIDTSPVQTFGKVMPGDIKYRDINGDGKIDTDDMVPLSNGAYPTLMYGLGLEFKYKNFSMGMLFKGTGKTDIYHHFNPMGYIPFYDGRNGNVLSIAMDPKNRWIPKDYAESVGIDPSLAENPDAMFPRLQYGKNENNTQCSDFWKDDARYLRLQELTLNYNLNTGFIRKIGLSSVDIQLVGTNLLVFDKIKMFDPEQAQSNGQAYPIPATYTLQLYLNF